MPEPRLGLTTTTLIAGATADDVRVVELGEGDVMIMVTRGAVALQVFGTLPTLQRLAVAVVDGLVEVGRTRGLEDSD